MGMNVPFSVLGADPELLAAHRDWLAPRFMNEDGATFPLMFQTWIVRAQGLNIVVDPCNGNGRTRPLMPFFHQLDTPFIERFAATGTRPEDVDIVFCTHLHCDHCGWNTQLRGGRWTPTFPNARYLFVRREVERWDPASNYPRLVEYNVGVFEECVQPVIDAGLAELVADHHELRPGMSISPAYGHTAGHSVLSLDMDKSKVYFTGDAFHHPLQVLDPRLHLGDDYDDAFAAIESRRRLLGVLVEEEAVMVPAHFPAPHGGRVERRKEGLRFVPLDD
jgi:glyoxylase-like metal-dependent hydrolase (beta-lactamase superfamily II)